MRKGERRTQVGESWGRAIQGDVRGTREKERAAETETHPHEERHLETLAVGNKGRGRNNVQK